MRKTAFPKTIYVYRDDDGIYKCEMYPEHALSKSPANQGTNNSGVAVYRIDPRTTVATVEVRKTP